MGNQGFPADGLPGDAIAAVLPPFDPLAPRGDQKATRRLLLISLLLHLVLFLVFGDALLGAVLQKDEVVVVRILEPEKPAPEPPKQRRKVLAQRRVDASVTHFKQLATPEIRQVKPVAVLDQARKVEIEPTEITEAPKVIQEREVVTETVSVFAEIESQPHPVEVDRVNPEVHRVRSARASAGPRKLEAGGPVTAPQPVDVEAPVVAKGVLSRNAVQGLDEGPRIASLEAGVSERMLEGRGDHGFLSGIDKDCQHDPVCQRYLRMIRDRVLARWHLPPDVPSGKVTLAFRVDRGGSAHGIQVRKIDDAELGETCLAAFRHASPFPPPPREIAYIINKNIRATFDYGK